MNEKTEKTAKKTNKLAAWALKKLSGKKSEMIFAQSVYVHIWENIFFNI